MVDNNSLKKKKRFPATAVDYRNFRLANINEPEFKHLWWLLFWPIYWIRYPIIEHINTPDRCFVMHCSLDDSIPFLEGFLLPYLFWTVMLLAFCLYTLLYDVDLFVKYSKFLVIAMSISTLIYIFFPTCQYLRPEIFPRDNILTRMVARLYITDTNTDVFPSEHVIGACSVWICGIKSSHCRSKIYVALLTLIAFSTAISTIFLKQHSVLDLIGAIPVCIIAYTLCFDDKNPKKKQAS